MALNEVVLAAIGVTASAWLPLASGQTLPQDSSAQYVSKTGAETLDSLVAAALKRNGELLSVRQRIAEAQGLLTQ